MKAAAGYDLIIIGGGITGASLLYTLSRYTNIKSILLLEKYGDFAQLNSNSRNNAQTLHFGDVETNYSIEKAIETRRAAERILRYTGSLGIPRRNLVIRRCQKMVLAVGDFESDLLDKYYYSGINRVFPGLRRIGRDRISKAEPNVVRGRDPGERIEALLSDGGHMVDFGRLTRAFAEDAMRNRNVRIDIRFNAEVKRIGRARDGYKVVAGNKEYSGRFVVAAAGTYSLYFAKSLGYAKNLSLFSVGGNFYYSRKALRGKVYRVQIGGIPFAAVHGDPDITDPKITRFGPTVTLPLEIERNHIKTIVDYARTFDFDVPTLKSLANIMLNRDIERILSRNAVYDVPVIGKYAFVKNEVSKIVPSLRSSDIWFANGIGGIRPQIIDEKKRSFVVGESKINGRGIIFNVTPSPGASSCLESALEDARNIAKEIDLRFDSDRYEKELGKL